VVKISEKLAAKIRPIKMVLTDCDGVLCPRTLTMCEGHDIKSFNALDGIGKYKLDALGIEYGIISGRASQTVLIRQQTELAVRCIHIGARDKVQTYESILTEYGFRPEEICYIGDDEPDTELLARVGFAVTPADTTTEVRSYADYVTIAKGGEGVLREVADLIQQVHET